MKATVSDLRYRMKDVLRAIDRGETVTVFYRGREKAKLTPVAAAPSLQDLPVFGMWRDREDFADAGAYVRNVRRPREFSAQRTRVRSRKG